MPVNPKKNLSAFEHDLLICTLYILDKHDLDIRNAYNIVNVLKQHYDFSKEDLEDLILYTYRNLNGLQSPSHAQLYSPCYTRNNIEGIYPYVNNPSNAGSRGKISVSMEEKREEREIKDLQYGESKDLPPRYDRRRTILKEDADFNGMSPDDFSSTSMGEKPKERTDPRFELIPMKINGLELGEAPTVDLIEVDDNGVIEAGVIYFSFDKEVSNQKKHDASYEFAKVYLQGLVEEVRKESPTATLRLEYFQPPHPVGSTALGFNSSMAFPDEFAMPFAVTEF